MGARPSKQSQRDPSVESNNSPSSNQSVSSPTIVIDGRIYHNIESSSYCLPRDEEEQDRLNSEHFAIKALFSNNILPYVEQQLPDNANILDIGCGSGSWVMEMAIEHPNAHVTGLDMADMFPTAIRPENVTFQLTNIIDGLPYDDNTFDFVHMRQLVVGLRATEWPNVIAEIFRVLKPGGLVQLVESDFTVHRGQDPWIASKLENLLSDRTFNDVQQETRTIEFGQDGDPIAGEMMWSWKSAMRSLKPFLAHRLLKNPDEYNPVLERYFQECTHYHWHMKIWALCAQKPSSITTHSTASLIASS
ncbi:S-adenosyl-L-methionine-dependent methyltransferase [Phascolomyces articulosus]|uniref:S-adenosyl-L-methionine-dependent methyltransferase n=1 Tax=Phascolomyces articulosus TaxID=60185 RepID=A0AAD5PFS3_9FUNG|nr:S-adenosyl-L-methionine-dependent methyltransferase [Phascolomyces articulosus]